MQFYNHLNKNRNKILKRELSRSLFNLNSYYYYAKLVKLILCNKIDNLRPKKFIKNEFVNQKLTELKADKIGKKKLIYNQIIVPNTCNSTNFPNSDIEKKYFECRWNYLIYNIIKNEYGFNKLLDNIHKLNKSYDTSHYEWNTYNTCERACNIIRGLSHSENIHFLEIKEIKEFLIKSGICIYNNLEVFGNKTNNHILNNARALILIGCIVNNVKLINLGKDIINRYLDVLIDEEGWLRERSSHYQLIVYIWICDILFYISNERQFPDLIDKLEKTKSNMENCLSMLIINNSIPLIGDISPDHSPRQSFEILRSYYFKNYTKIISKSIVSPYKNSGWIRVNNNNNVIIAQVSSHYPSKFPDHGHTDLTHFLWYYKNINILRDNGRYSYSGNKIDIYHRSNFSHNVLLLNYYGPYCDSFTKRYNWRPFGYSKVKTNINVKNSSISIEHDGFKRINKTISHNRTIKFINNGLVVIDNIEGKGNYNISTLWHLCSDARISQKKMKYDIFTEKITIELNSIVSSGKVHTEIYENAISDKYGSYENSKLIMYSYNVSLPIIITTDFKEI